jgi:hypothetical protein
MNVNLGISGPSRPSLLKRFHSACRPRGSALRKSLDVYDRPAAKIRVGLSTIRCKQDGVLTFDCVSPRTSEMLGLRAGGHSTVP